MTPLNQQFRRVLRVTPLLLLAALLLPHKALAAGPVDHFAVTVSPRPVTAGQDFTITTTAKDAANATVKDYADDTQFKDTSGSLSTSEPGKWTGGVSKTTASVKLAGLGDVITVETVKGISGQSAAFNVVGPADHIVVSVSPRPATVGQDITITATAKDANNLTVASYSANPKVEDSSQVLSVPDPGQFVNGVLKTTATANSAVHGDVVYVANPADGLTGQSAAFNITGAVDHLSLSVKSSAAPNLLYGPPGSLEVTARALDAAGNTVTGYSGPATWSDSAGLLSPSSPSDFVAGVSRTTAQASSPVRGDVLTLASAGNSVQGKFNAIGPVDHFDAHVPSSAQVGTPFSMTVYARDAAGNVATNYCCFGDYYTRAGDLVELAPFQNGVSRNTVTWPNPEHQLQIQVTDLRQTTINPIDIIGPAVTPVASFQRTDHSTSCASIKGVLTLKMVDAAGNLLSDYNDDMWAGMDSGFLHDTPVQPAKPVPFVNGVSRTKLSILNSDGRTQDWMLVFPEPEFMQIC